MCLALLTEMASEPDHRAGDLGPPVHPAGLPTLRRSADPGFPRGGEVDAPGVCLFCSYHPDHSGVWRLRRRYRSSIYPRSTAAFLLASESLESVPEGDAPWTGCAAAPRTLTL